MTDAVLRFPKERVLTPLARALPRRIHPLAITLSGMVPGVWAAVEASRRHFALALALWLVNRLMDGLDGTVARVQGRQSDFGAYADIHADFVVYAAIPIGVAFAVDSNIHWIATTVLLATFYLNTVSWAYLAALLERRGHESCGTFTSITMPGGLIEGAETIVLYSSMLAAPRWATEVVWIMGAAVILTVGQRLMWASTEL